MKSLVSISNIRWQRTPVGVSIVRENSQIALVGICSVIKSESAYINEWLDYHEALGFGRFYLFDNSEHFELESWFSTRNFTSVIKIFHTPGMKVQLQSYFNCAQVSAMHNVKWIYFTDVDEFLVLKKHNNIHDFLEQYCTDGSLSLNWRVFGTSGKKLYEPKPVLKRFQYRLDDDDQLNLYVKSFVLTRDLKLHREEFIDPHFFPLKSNASQKDTNGAVFTGSLHSGPGDVALIYHYKFKSYEEYFKNKLARGDVFYGGEYGCIREPNGTYQTYQQLPKGSVYDDTAWKILLENVPKFKIYDLLD